MSLNASVVLEHLVLIRLSFGGHISNIKPFRAWNILKPLEHWDCKLWRELLRAQELEWQEHLMRLHPEKITRKTLSKNRRKMKRVEEDQRLLECK